MNIAPTNPLTLVQLFVRVTVVMGRVWARGVYKMGTRNAAILLIFPFTSSSASEFSNNRPRFIHTGSNPSHGFFVGAAIRRCSHRFLASRFRSRSTSWHERGRDPPQAHLPKMYQERRLHNPTDFHRARLQLALAPYHFWYYQLLHRKHLGQHSLPGRHYLCQELRTRW
ncbi:hypothetical protein BDZ94DRAFT_1183601, partial [Collybia nuda]